MAANVASLAARRHGAPRVAVIGAGTSGLATAAALLREGIEPVVLEGRAQPGGIWSQLRHPAMYEGLVQNTAPHLTVFEELPWHPPAQGTHYSADEYRAYCSAYIDAGGLEPYLLTNATVTAVRPLDGGGCAVHVRDGGGQDATATCDHVVYAGGLYHVPSRPDLPGAASFPGPMPHSSELDIAALAGRKVLVVGLGNTALDVAAALLPVAAELALSGRGATWIVPRLLDGLPVDVFVQQLRREHGPDYRRHLWAASRRHGAVAFDVAADDQELDFTRQRITVNDAMLAPLAEGRVALYATIATIDGDTVHFADGDRARFDAIVFCTGYRSAPLIEGDVVDEHLLGNVLHPRRDGLWFVGAPAVWGGSPPIAQKQGQLAAHAIARGWRRADLAAAVDAHGGYEKAAVVLPFGFEVVEFTGYARMVDDIRAAQGASAAAAMRHA